MAKLTHVGIKFQSTYTHTKTYVYRVPDTCRMKIQPGGWVLVTSPGGEVKLAKVQRVYDAATPYQEERGISYKEITGVAFQL